MAIALVLGANGRIGREAVRSFLNAGWSVRAFIRPGRGDGVPRGATLIEGDAASADDLAEAATGADVIFNGLNPPYTHWRRDACRLADAVVEATRRTGATHLFPGNVYNYGTNLPSLLEATTPMNPDTVKGKIRQDMESRFRQAADTGVQTLILRAGDFFGGTGTGSWFDLVIAKSVPGGKVTYPGPLDTEHAWAYLPDLTDTIVQLAGRRKHLAGFDEFRFEGHTVTGRQMVTAISAACGRSMKTASLPWWFIRIASPFVKTWAETLEMEYLWRKPHRMVDTRLTKLLGTSDQTPFDKAIETALNDLGIATAPVARPALAA